ncbi:phage tail protein [Paenibacillus dokdonensis]|uniref:Phage tail protein n=1 Tax=Paenibacillus dokdonensis TaxID=2567944 RepID=A0ABU6GSP2_9BACL|nr:phage tail protein [Paenibacillus dokdonensis]MEC0242760.1 phage tail protein [Paenibacillus dokdonensis]
MPEKSSFFDSTPGDERLYAARDFAEYFAQFLTNGVFKSGTNLSVTATGSDANIRINPGYAWINGYMYSVYDSFLSLPIQPATTQDRIDRIILRLDISPPIRLVKAIVVQGQPSASPVAPVLTRSGNIYDISLARILVKAGSSIVLAANISDERENSAVCGLVNSLIRDGNEATLTQKGVTQLSNATNGTRENVAATEKAVSLAVAASQIPYTDKTLIERRMNDSKLLTQNSVTTLAYTVNSRDTLNEYDGSTGKLSVKRTGIYYIGLSFELVANVSVTTKIPINTTFTATLLRDSSTTVGTITEMTTVKEALFGYLYGGIILELSPFYSYQIGLKSTSVNTMANGSDKTSLTIIRLS